MKQSLAILLLGLFLFNLLGYRWVYSYLENASDKSVEQSLDRHTYSESELVLVMIPMNHLPYYSNSNQYEPVEGKIESNGVLYHFVKRRVYHDSLELWCLPDQKTMELQTAKNDFFKLVNDLEHAGQQKRSGSHSGSQKNLSMEYLFSDALVFHDGDFSHSKKKISHKVPVILSAFTFDREQPPKSC